MSFFNDLLHSLFTKKIAKSNFNFLFEKKNILNLEELINKVAVAKGEVSALNYSEKLLDFLEETDEKDICVHVGCRTWINGSTIHYNRILE